MSKRLILTITGILLLVASITGVTGALANTDLKTTYASILSKNSFLIQNSLLQDELVQKLANSDPNKSQWIQNALNYLDEKKALDTLAVQTSEKYSEQVATQKGILETKLNAAYEYLAANPNSSAKDVLENTTATINSALQNSDTALETLVAGNELISENNDFFKIVVAYEARKQYFENLRNFITRTEGIQLASGANNNVAIDEINSLLDTAKNSLSQENNKDFDSVSAIAALPELEARAASAEQAVNAEAARIAEEIRIAEEERQRKEAEAAAYRAAHPAITYKHILIDISDQTMYRLEGDTILDSSPVVTGIPNSYDTVRGTYAIYTKQRNTYLTSPFPGISYRVFVNYWMPFFSGYGIHDAVWRSAFGGNIYQYNGSHGCANTPPWYAAVIWDWAEVGTTVQVID